MVELGKATGASKSLIEAGNFCQVKYCANEYSGDDHDRNEHGSLPRYISHLNHKNNNNKGFRVL